MLEFCQAILEPRPAVGLAVTLTILRGSAKAPVETSTSPSLEEELEQNELFAAEL